MLKSERLYTSTPIVVERARYHFVRAIAEMELGYYEKVFIQYLIN